MKNILFAVLFIISQNALATNGGAGSGISTPTTVRMTEILGVGGGELGATIFKNSSSGISLQTLPIDSDEVDRQLANTACDVDENVVCDANPGPVPKDYMEFLTSFSTFKKQQTSYSPITSVTQIKSKCDCIARKVSNETVGNFEDAKKAKRDEINKYILDAYGKKFINDFSSNIEDVTFFLGRTAEMFTSEEVGKGLQCNDEAIYNAKVTEVCGSRGITDAEFINGRKNKFINTIGGGISLPFDQRLGTMAREIMGARITSDFDETNGHIYARENFDALRMGLAVSDPQAKFVDLLVSQLLRNGELRSQISQAMLSDMTPVEAIIKVVDENKTTANFRNLGLGADASQHLKDKESLSSVLRFMMKVHPGFLHVMKDKDAFGNLKIAYGRNPQLGILNQLKDKSVLEPVLIENCKKMVESFANAVCTPDDKLISSMDPLDLQLLLQAKQERPQALARKADMNDVLICEAKTSSVEQGNRFSELANLMDRRLRSTSSDYYERLMAEGGGTGGASGGGSGHAAQAASDAFSLAAQYGAASKNYQDALNKLTDLGRKHSTSVSAGGVVSRQVEAENVIAGRDFRVGSGSMNREQARRYLAESKTWEDKKAAQNAAIANNTKETPATQDLGYSSQATNAAPQVAPVTNNQYVAQPVTTSTTQQAREALRQYIADKNDSATAKEVVEALDDPSAVELNRLRSENVTLLEKTLKMETEKFEDMKKRIADLEKTTPVKAPVIKATEEKEVPMRTSLSNLRQSFAAAPVKPIQAPSRSIASVSGQFSSQSSASTSTESKSQGRGPKVVTENASQSAGLIVTKVSPGRDSDVKPQELQQEVQKLLESPNLNQSSLEEIKAKGFLYRYSVVENNETVQKEVLIKFEKLDKATRDAIELKLTRKTAENQVSKLAVLRLLIKQQRL